MTLPAGTGPQGQELGDVEQRERYADQGGHELHALPPGDDPRFGGLPHTTQAPHRAPFVLEDVLDPVGTRPVGERDDQAIPGPEGRHRGSVLTPGHPTSMADHRERRQTSRHQPGDGVGHVLVEPADEPRDRHSAILPWVAHLEPPSHAWSMATAQIPEVRAPRGPERSCKGWPQEAALRMLMNNLDPDVAERPQDLVVYGGTGKAARSWDAFHQIVRALRSLEGDETLLIQSGKPVAVFRTHPAAPRVLISNAMLVPKWASWETFWELERAGLTMYGQMTAGSWIYIGTQGILQGTYETLGELAAQRFGGSLKGRIVLTAGLGGMGGAQPLAVTMNEGVALVVEVDPSRIERRIKTRYLDRE